MKHAIEAGAVAVVAAVVRRLSMATVRRLGRRIGWLAYRVDRFHRRIALDNLAHALPARSAAEREEIAQAIDRVRGDAGVLLLIDMFGGTPSNLGMTFLEKDRLEVITGVNLPMLIKLAKVRTD